MRTLDPACKFVSLLCATFVLAARHDPVWNLAAFFLAVGWMLISRVRGKTMGLLLLPVLLTAAGMFFTGYRFSADGALPFRAETLHIGDSALWNGLTLSSRVLAYAGLGLLFALTTDRVDMVRSFQRRFRLPQVFAYGLLAAWGNLPQAAREYRRTKAAFRARGIRVAPMSPALLMPLLVKAVRWSEELSVAMESKGFSSGAERSEFARSRLRRRDWAALLCGCVLLPLAAALWK